MNLHETRSAYYPTSPEIKIQDYWLLFIIIFFCFENNVTKLWKTNEKILLKSIFNWISIGLGHFSRDTFWAFFSAEISEMTKFLIIIYESFTSKIYNIFSESYFGYLSILFRNFLRKFRFFSKIWKHKKLSKTLYFLRFLNLVRILIFGQYLDFDQNLDFWSEFGFLIRIFDYWSEFGFLIRIFDYW